MQIAWCSGFLPHFKDLKVRLISDSKMAVGVNVSVNGYLLRRC